MTTPFRVPEPSLEAVRVAMERTILGRMGDEATCRRIVRELYLEDLPRIVRSEVERFREWRQSVALYGVTQEDDEREYLAARFPEPPETRNLGNLFDGLVGSISAPSAETAFLAARYDVENIPSGRWHIQNTSPRPITVAVSPPVVLAPNEWLVVENGVEVKSPKAETATPKAKECPCTGRACPYDCDPLCNETPGDPCQGAKCFHATGIREGDPVPSEPHWQSLARALYPMGPMTEAERAFLRALAEMYGGEVIPPAAEQAERRYEAVEVAARRVVGP